jgi:predicted N-acetyltransferase YhbS
LTHIVPLRQISEDSVENLLDAAFGADRKARTAYKMRAGCRPIDALSFAAIDAAGTLLGTLQSWPVALESEDGARIVMTLVGPVAVAPKIQRAGIGKMLMEHLVEAAQMHGHQALVMIGDPEYYGRFFRFTAETTAGWMVPGPVERHRLLAKISRSDGMPHHGRIVPNP